MQPISFLLNPKTKLAFILVLALIIRLAGIASRPIWYDESFSILISEQGPSAILSGTLTTDADSSAAEGLRAGVPSVIVPFAFDQFFWGARIKELGLGPDPIPQKNLTADRLANAIRISVTDSKIRQRANSYGAAIRAENGIGNAVEIIKRHFGEPGAGESERSA